MRMFRGSARILTGGLGSKSANMLTRGYGLRDLRMLKGSAPILTGGLGSKSSNLLTRGYGLRDLLAIAPILFRALVYKLGPKLFHGR
jgi:hypothetical protein